MHRRQPSIATGVPPKLSRLNAGPISGFFFSIFAFPVMRGQSWRGTQTSNGSENKHHLAPRYKRPGTALVTSNGAAAVQRDRRKEASDVCSHHSVVVSSDLPCPTPCRFHNKFFCLFFFSPVSCFRPVTQPPCASANRQKTRLSAVGAPT